MRWISKSIVSAIATAALAACAFAAKIQVFEIDYDYNDGLSVTGVTHSATMNLFVDALLDGAYNWDVPELRHWDQMYVEYFDSQVQPTDNYLYNNGTVSTLSAQASLVTNHTYVVRFRWKPEGQNDVPDLNTPYLCRTDMYRLSKARSRINLYGSNHTYYLDGASTLHSPTDAFASLGQFSQGGPVSGAIRIHGEPDGDPLPYDYPLDHTNWEWAGEYALQVYFDGTQDADGCYIGEGTNLGDGASSGLWYHVVPGSTTSGNIGGHDLYVGYWAGFVFRELEDVDEEIKDCLDSDYAVNETWYRVTGIDSRQDDGTIPEGVYNDECLCGTTGGFTTGMTTGVSTGPMPLYANTGDGIAFPLALLVMTGLCCGIPFVVKKATKK